MAVTNPPGWLQNAGSTHTAAQLRTYIAALQAANFSTATSLRARGGVHPTFGLQLVVTQAGSPNMTVLVEAGSASIPGTESSTQGNYIVTNDAQVTLSITTAHASLPRIDIVVFNVRDTQYSGGSNDSQLQVIAGTPASSPVPPTAPVNSITLAQVAVGAGVTSIVNANITDTRFYLAGAGGVIAARNEAARPPSAEVTGGQLVWTMDNKKLWMWNDTIYVQTFPNALGMIARGNRTTSKTFSGTEVGVIRLDSVAVLANRAYLIMTSSLDVQVATAGDTGLVRIRFTTDGSSATTSSTLMFEADVNANSTFVPANSAVMNVVYIPGSDLNLSVLLCLNRSGGAGNVTMNGSATKPIEIYVIDMGPAPADTGVDI